MFAGQQHFANLFDGIAFVAHFLHFLAGPVFGGVGHGVATVAVCFHFQNIGAFAGPAVRGRFFGGFLDGQHVHAVDDFTGDAEGFATGIEIGGRGGAFLGCAHGVLVVFDHENHRQFPQGGHVECLVNLALVCSAVAEIGEGHVVVAFVFVRKGKARAKGDLCRNDAVAAVEILFFREHVHGATLALGIAALAARQLSHDAVGVHAAGQHVAVIAVGGDAFVTVFGRSLKADNNGLLSDVEVAEAADETHSIELTGLFLESTDQQHVLVVTQQLLSGDI